MTPIIVLKQQHIFSSKAVLDCSAKQNKWLTMHLSLAYSLPTSGLGRNRYASIILLRYVSYTSSSLVTSPGQLAPTPAWSNDCLPLHQEQPDCHILVILRQSSRNLSSVPPTYWWEQWFLSPENRDHYLHSNLLSATSGSQHSPMSTCVLNSLTDLTVAFETDKKEKERFQIWARSF